MGNVKILAEGVEYYPDEELVLLIRYPRCGAENYELAVATGICVWCNYDANELIKKKC